MIMIAFIALPLLEGMKLNMCFHIKLDATDLTTSLFLYIWCS